MKKYIPCPCNGKLLYHKCCRPYHDGVGPDTAEKLMRSRFSAYALGLSDYIMDTTHSQNENFSDDRAAWGDGIKVFSDGTSFTELEILDASPADGDVAFVTFRASLMQSGRDASFTERSEFRRENGRWLYYRGELLNATD